MGKQPAFQFYVGDWLKDTRCLSLEAKGAWIDLLNFMWHAETRGKLSLTWIEYSRQLGTDVQQAQRAICELIDLGICDCCLDGEKMMNVVHVTNCHKKVTLLNRRMVKEEEKRRNAALRKAKSREKRRENPTGNHGKNGCHRNVTTHSSSSSSFNNICIHNNKCIDMYASDDKSSDAKNNKKSKKIDINFSFEMKKFLNVNISDFERWEKAYPAINIEIEILEAAEWLISNPKNRKSNYRRFLTAWLKRSQDRAPKIDQKKKDYTERLREEAKKRGMME